MGGKVTAPPAVVGRAGQELSERLMQRECGKKNMEYLGGKNGTSLSTYTDILMSCLDYSHFPGSHSESSGGFHIYFAWRVSPETRLLYNRGETKK